MFHLLSLLASILTGLRATIARVSPRRRAHIPVVTPPLDHINHMFACFERLYADWCNGTLPESRERADPPVAAVARLSRPTLPNPTKTAPRTPTPPPAPSAPLAGPSASHRCPRNARAPPPRKTRLSRAPTHALIVSI